MELSQKDIEALAKGFASKPTPGKINFGLRRTNNLKATVNWARDFRRCSRSIALDPTVIDAPMFLDLIKRARLRAEIRRHNAEESDKQSKTADPGKLKKQKEWISWSRGLSNYLSTIQGHDGVPLSYVIRKNELPDYSLELEPNYNFEQLTYHCAPLSGPIFESDARKVHQIIFGFLQGEIAEAWIKPKEKKQNGRIDFAALEAHYGGEGNKAIRIAESERMRHNLTYKSERIMSFEKFLTNMQVMFTGYRDNSEHLSETVKIRLLFDKVQCPILKNLKDLMLLQSNLDTAGGPTLTYDFIANQFAAYVASQTDPTPNRQASGVGTKDQAPASGIKNADGSIYTGLYPNWKDLNQHQRSSIFQERKKLNINFVLPQGNHQGNHHKPRSSGYNKKKKPHIQRMQREISSLRNQNQKLRAKRGASEDEAGEPQDDAGNQFGGRRGKKEQKQQN